MTTIGSAVHYADFGNWDDVFADGAAYSVKTSVLRIGLDLQQFMAPQGVPVRPYLTAGVALCRNRYVDWVQNSGEFESISNNLAASVGGGVAFGPMEMSVLYTFNPVRNRELPVSDDALDHDFNWNYVVVRAGIAFGD